MREDSPIGAWVSCEFDVIVAVQAQAQALVQALVHQDIQELILVLDYPYQGANPKSQKYSNENHDYYSVPRNLWQYPILKSYPLLKLRLQYSPSSQKP